MNDVVDGGPFGNILYADDPISIFIPGSADSYTASWYWDEARETVAIKGPLSAFSNFYEDDPAIGTTKYIFTMRAAWVTKVVYNRLREQIYEVLY